MFHSSVNAKHVNYFFTTNIIIIINRFLKIYEIVIVQNLATRYVTMFLLQKNVPNFKVIKMFVFAYCTTALITIFIVHLIFREIERFSPEIKIILQKYGVLQIKSRQIRYQIWHYYSKMVEVMTFLCILLHVRVYTVPS